MLFQYQETMKRLGNDPVLLAEFTQIFREDSPRMLKTMDSAVESGDQDTFRETAHALKGLVSNFGAEKAVAIAAEMEAEEFEAGCGETGRRVENLKKLLAQLDEELTAAADNS